MVKKGNLGGLAICRGLLAWKTILQGPVKGKKVSSMQRKRWNDNITEWIGMDFAGSARAAENRTKQKRIVVKSPVKLQQPCKVMGQSRTE